MPAASTAKNALMVAISMGMGIGITLTTQHWNRQTNQLTNQPPIKQNPSLVSPLLLTGEPWIGSKDAPLTIVEFSDFECLYCQRFHQTVLPKLKKEYIESGLVRFIHKDLPLPFHSQAKPAAAAARCAGKQNRYWQMYRALFDQQACLQCKGAKGIALEQELNTTELERCMSRPTTLAHINANVSEAQLHSIRATPTFVIGRTQADNSHSGTIIEGALPWPQFKTMVDQHLTALRGT
jgi:protein-disulfide isomerase